MKDIIKELEDVLEKAFDPDLESLNRELIQDFVLEAIEEAREDGISAGMDLVKATYEANKEAWEKEAREEIKREVEKICGDTFSGKTLREHRELDEFYKKLEKLKNIITGKFSKNEVEIIKKDFEIQFKKELREKMKNIKFRKKDQMEDAKDYMDKKIGFDKDIENILKLIN